MPTIDDAPAPMPPPRPRSVVAARLFVSRNPSQVTAWCTVLLLLIAAFAAFYVARAYLLPIVAAFVLSVLLAPLANMLERAFVPRSAAAGLMVLGVCALAYVAVVLVAQPASRWIAEAPQIAESMRGHLEALQETVESVEEITDEVQSITDNGEPAAQEVVVQGPNLTSSIAGSLRTITVQILFVLVLTYFFLATRSEIRLKLIAAQPSLAGRLHVARIFRDVERQVGGFLTTLSMVNLGLGASVALAMWALGMPSPIMWGGLAALLNFVPYVGPAILTLLLGAAGLATFETLSGALMPPLAFAALNFLESNFVTPLVVGRRMTLNPLAILLAVSFWSWMWGPVGGLLSIPMIVMLKVICDHTSGLKPIGELIGGPLKRHDEPARPLRALARRLAGADRRGPAREAQPPSLKRTM